jgi:hypothetical protein
MSRRMIVSAAARVRPSLGHEEDGGRIVLHPAPVRSTRWASYELAHALAGGPMWVASLRDRSDIGGRGPILDVLVFGCEF